MISKKEIRHLASLSRMDLSEAEEDVLSRDLGNILAHFEELKELNTDDTEPLTGGSLTDTVMRTDTGEGRVEGAAAKKSFPEEEKGFLKVPPVFE